MIFYFTGTGNSEYVAKRIGSAANDTVLNLAQFLPASKTNTFSSKTPWVIVAPIYAWRIPRVVSDWFSHAELTGNQKVYFVVTCAEDAGNAGKYAEKLCAEKNLEFMGCASIKMPTNNIAMFQTPTRSEAQKIILDAQPDIQNVCDTICTGIKFPMEQVSLQGKAKSQMVNGFFYSAFVKTKDFYATDRCISCGKCEKACPLKNIYLVGGRPVWGVNCTHCMACINDCPKEAIEYGNQSKGRPRYHFEEPSRPQLK